MSTVIEELPLFPLDVVLYPGEVLPLHIFEDRYRRMVEDCLQADQPFGVLLSEEEDVAEVGCTARIQEIIQRYEDGRLDILTLGERRFRVRRVDEARAAYLTGEVETIDEPDEVVPQGMRERVITQHMKLLELTGHTVRPSVYENREDLSYTLANNAGLSLGQKQEVLELLTEGERMHYLADYFEDFLPRVEKEESLRRRIQSNGHFEDFPPEL